MHTLSLSWEVKRFFPTNFQFEVKQFRKKKKTKESMTKHSEKEDSNYIENTLHDRTTRYNE